MEGHRLFTRELSMVFRRTVSPSLLTIQPTKPKLPNIIRCVLWSPSVFEYGRLLFVTPWLAGVLFSGALSHIPDASDFEQWSISL